MLVLVHKSSRINKLTSMKSETLNEIKPIFYCNFCENFHCEQEIFFLSLKKITQQCIVSWLAVKNETPVNM